MGCMSVSCLFHPLKGLIHRLPKLAKSELGPIFNLSHPFLHFLSNRTYLYTTGWGDLFHICLDLLSPFRNLALILFFQFTKVGIRLLPHFFNVIFRGQKGQLSLQVIFDFLIHLESHPLVMYVLSTIKHLKYQSFFASLFKVGFKFLPSIFFLTKKCFVVCFTRLFPCLQSNLTN